MFVNKGVAPPDLGSDVGKVRVLLGDVEYTDLEPPEAGFGSYRMFSDLEIDGFLVVAEGSVEGATYFGYLQLAGSAAMESESIQDFDLKVDSTKRAGDLRAVALMWRDRWDASTADIFEVFDVGSASECWCVAELAMRPIGGCVGCRFF